MQQLSSRKAGYRLSSVRYGTHVTSGNSGQLEGSRVNMSRGELAWSRRGYVTIQPSDRIHVVMWQYSGMTEFTSLCDNTAEWQNSCRNVTIQRSDRIHVVTTRQHHISPKILNSLRISQIARVFAIASRSFDRQNSQWWQFYQARCPHSVAVALVYRRQSHGELWEELRWGYNRWGGRHGMYW